MSPSAPASAPALSAPAVRIDRLEVIRLRGGHWTLEGGTAYSTCFEVIYLVSGAARLAGDPPLLQAGELAVMSIRHRLHVELDEGTELIIVRIPEAAAGPHAQTLRAAAGRVLAAGQGSSGLVAHLIRGLAAEGFSATEHPNRLAQHVVGLIGLMCLDAGDDETGWRSTMLRDAIDYIEDHLGELDLTPDRIAAEQNISTRTLHRLFEREGLTLGGWIRTRRLENCRAELVDPAHLGMSVSAIGARWGLWDAAHFSRLFKSTFGASPRSFRQDVLNGRPEHAGLRASA